LNGSTITILVAIYLVIGFSVAFVVWDTDHANLDVVQDRGRARRRAALSVAIALMWPSALLIVAIYTCTERGHALLRHILFGRD